MTFSARILIAACAAVVLVSCHGPNPASNALPFKAVQSSVQPPGGNAFKNSGFETGKLPPWGRCLNVGGKISTYDPYQGKYSGLVGTSNKKEGEVRYSGGLCQEIVVPNHPFLTAHLRPVSDDFTKGMGQQIDVYNATNGKFITFLWTDDKNSKTWIYLHKNVQYELGSYVGDKVIVAFAVVTPGSKNKYIGLWFDNVDLSSK
jgi:hypothetical protein